MKRLFLLSATVALLMIACDPTVDAPAPIIQDGTETPADSTGTAPADSTGTAPADSTVVTPSDGTGLYAKPELVDLGLPSGVKWAASDLGSTDGRVPGAYFSWGDTEARTYFGDSAKYWESDGLNGYATKYSVSMRSGRVLDMKTILDPEDDAATVHLGKDWRTPTYDDFYELLDYCDYRQMFITDYLGREVQVYEFTSRTNGASITFYAQPETLHMSSSLICTDDRGTLNNGVYYFNNGCNLIGSNARPQGMLVRPVQGGEAKPFEWKVNADPNPGISSGTATIGGIFHFEEEPLWNYVYSVRLFDSTEGDYYSQKYDLPARTEKAVFSGLVSGKTYYYMVCYEATKRDGGYTLWQGSNSEIRSFVAQ